MKQEERGRRRDFSLGLVLSVVGGIALLAGGDLWDSFGWAFVLGIPITVGFVLGYTTGPRRALVVFFSFFLALTLLLGAVTMQISGVFCGVVAACIMIVPTGIGIALGAHARDRTEGRPHVATSIALMMACSALVYGEAQIQERRPEEEITTTRILAMDPERAWQVLTFYEDVDIEPPLYARIGLPHPLRTEGPMRRVGDITRCVYSTGYLRKRITTFEPGHELAFDVVEQVGIEDRSVELVRGSFRFEARGDGRTEVSLTTVYRPLLAARPVWRPFEQRLAHVLHEHVLDGMEHEHRKRFTLLAQSAAATTRRP